MRDTTKEYEDMAKALAQLPEESFENFLKNYDEEYKELFRKMRGFYKLMTSKNYYEKIQNEVARRFWRDANAQ